MKFRLAFALLMYLLLGSASSNAVILTGAGFRIPDNDPNGASSSVTAAATDLIVDLVITVDFPVPAGGPTGGHTWCGDLAATISLTPADGGPVLTQSLFNRIGVNSATSFGDSSDLAGRYTFSDSAPLPTLWQSAAAVGSTAPVPNGSYAPSSRDSGFQYQAVTFFSVFSGRPVAGTWTLNISDNVSGDTGGIASWTLQTFLPAPGMAILATTALLPSLRRDRRWG